MIILLFGLPTAGKTTQAGRILASTPGVHLNADVVREQYDDWDFSPKGRIRQSFRMHRLAQEAQQGQLVIVDFVCPYRESRLMFAGALRIWMNTIAMGPYEDTNALFQKPLPDEYELEVTSFSPSALVL